MILKDVPFNVTDIATKLYQTRIQEEGGVQEYMKLWIYTLHHHKMAIYLDLDTLLLQPLDELWDAMLNAKHGSAIPTEVSSLYQPRYHQRINFMFTRDYMQGSTIVPLNTTDRHNITTKWGVQGGMWVVRPSHVKFRELVQTVLEGNFRSTRGWHLEDYGGYYGAAQIQGLLSYAYRPSLTSMTTGGAVELNRCIYNNRYDPARFAKGQYEGRCITLEDTCTTECRTTAFDTIKLAHMTVCSKPWKCDRLDDSAEHCTKVLERWFETRRSFEASVNFSIPKSEKSSWFHVYSLGYCRKEEVKDKNAKSGGMKVYKGYKGFYRRIIFPWDPIIRHKMLN